MTREWSAGRIHARRDPGRRDAKDERDRGGQRDRRRSQEDQDHVLDHVDREQGRVVALDARLERHGDRREAQQEERRPIAGDRVRRVRRVDPPDGPQVCRGGRRERQPDRRVERPAEHERCGIRRARHDASVCRGRRCAGKDREHDRRSRQHPAQDATLHGGRREPGGARDRGRAAGHRRAPRIRVGHGSDCGANRARSRGSGGRTSRGWEHLPRCVRICASLRSLRVSCPRLGTSAIPGARARRGRGRRTRPDGAPPARARGRTHPWV